MCFRGIGVLIFIGETERSGSYRIEAPCSNPFQGLDFYFLIFSATTSPGTQCPKINDNSKFNAN